MGRLCKSGIIDSGGGGRRVSNPPLRDYSKAILIVVTEWRRRFGMVGRVPWGIAACCVADGGCVKVALRGSDG